MNYHVRLKKTKKEIENPDADEKPKADQNQKENEHPDIDVIKNEPLQSIQDRGEPNYGKKRNAAYTRKTRTKMKMSSKLLSYVSVI